MGSLLIRRLMLVGAEKEELPIIPSTSGVNGGTSLTFYSGTNSSSTKVATKSYQNAALQMATNFATQDGVLSATFTNPTENSVSIGTLYAGGIYPKYGEGTLKKKAYLYVFESSTYKNVGSVPAGGSITIDNIQYKGGTFPAVWLPRYLSCELRGNLPEYVLPNADFTTTENSTGSGIVTGYSDDGATQAFQSGHYATVCWTDVFQEDTQLEVYIQNTGWCRNPNIIAVGSFQNTVTTCHYAIRCDSSSSFIAHSFFRLSYLVRAGYRFGIIGNTTNIICAAE